MKVYLVGGAVRDQLLGREVKERDWVVVGETPEAMIDLGYKPVGKDFPVFLHPDTQEEYALARTERKTGKGYTGFSCYAEPNVTLEEDLQRRDLTINAMAQTTEDKIIDPFNGQKDLKAKLFRHVSDAFVEDPVRILRVARFAARFVDFNVADETMQLMQKMVNNSEVDALVPERVWKEFSRALTEKAPQRFFEIIQHCGAQKVIFPEIDDFSGLLNSLTLTNDAHIRFASLTHHLNESAIKSLCKRLNSPRQYRDLAILVSKYQPLFHQLDSDDATAIVTLLQRLDSYRRPKRLPEFILACRANSTDNNAKATGDLLLKAFEAAKQVDTQALVDQGLEGPEFAKAITEQRMKLVQKIL